MSAQLTYVIQFVADMDTSIQFCRSRLARFVDQQGIEYSVSGD